MTAKGNSRSSGYERADHALAAEDIRLAFTYDASAGRLLRLVASGKAAAGTICGSQDRLGYRQIRFKGRLFSESRLVWLWVTGAPSKVEIDHINGDRSDNRIANLREATRLENVRNKAPSGINLKGATQRKSGRWRAQICVNRKKISLGHYDTEREAHDAYARSATKLFGQFARLK